MKYSKEQLVKMYEQLQLSRIFEEKLIELVAEGSLPGFYHLAIGQEAVQIGAVSAMDDDDYLVPTHRSHPAVVNRLELDKFFCELLGHYDGYNQGKGWEHVSSVERKVLPASGDLGVGAPLAVGYAWALKMDKKDSVVVCLCGDGASSEGNVHEAMNIAALFKLPIVFLIENNKWAISTPFSKQTAVDKLSKRAAGYGMKGVTIDGNDVLTVRATMDEAIAKARKGEPSVVEAVTYRWKGHFEGDPATYRNADDQKEVEEAMKNCPIKKFKAMLLQENVMTPEDMEAVDKNILQKIEDAIVEARKSPLPTEKQTVDYDAVYATNLGGDLV